MPKPSKASDSEIYNFELHRRMDELHAVINYACVLFSKELRLEDDLKELDKLNKSKWLWITFILGIILNLFLRKSGLFSFEFEWNLGSYLETFCLLIFAANLIKENLIRMKFESNQDKLKELAFKFDSITSDGHRFWEIRRFVDIHGQFKTEGYYGENEENSYINWLNKVSKNLERKIKTYTED